MSSETYTRYIFNLSTECSCAHQDITGIGGEFDDPETGSVTSYSSRGPCYVNSGSGIETRLKPVTTAATGLQTSTGLSGLVNSSRCNEIP